MRTREVKFPGLGKEGADLVLRLIDDGYRIRFETVSGAPDNFAGEQFDWAEYKRCDVPRYARLIVDLLMGQSG